MIPFDNPDFFFISPPHLSPDKKPEYFFGNNYIKNPNASRELISILSGGCFETCFPYSFHLHPLNCYMLLYTETGYGKLHLDHNILTLEDNSLLFLKCDKPLKLEIAVSPWNYKMFLLEGNVLDFYYSLLSHEGAPLFSLPSHSPVIRTIQRLTLIKDSSSMRDKLYESRLITDILCDLFMNYIEPENRQEKIPPYLQEMKTLFDTNYQESYTLDELEESFTISKFRLCREFHAYFGESPLQYLNNKRIDIAKDLLQTTDYRIHEIGSLVGIDNTNHFINLFKKQVGLTPLSYRKEY